MFAHMYTSMMISGMDNYNANNERRLTCNL